MMSSRLSTLSTASCSRSFPSWSGHKAAGMVPTPTLCYLDRSSVHLRNPANPHRLSSKEGGHQVRIRRMPRGHSHTSFKPGFKEACLWPLRSCVAAEATSTRCSCGSASSHESFQAEGSKRWFRADEQQADLCHTSNGNGFTQISTSGKLDT